MGPRRFSPSRSTAAALLICAATGAAPVAGQVPETLVVSSDSALAELASALLPDLARRSGLELLAPVRLEVRSREELGRYLTHKLDEELPEEKARSIVDAYALFGLVPADLDLRGVLMGLYTEQVAGYYEPDSTALFVMDDQAGGELEGLLLHELVHAVQDQHADLDALTDDSLGNDRRSAAQAAIEGHATLVMFEYLVERQAGTAVDLGKLPGFGVLLRQSLEEVRTQFPALAGAPRVLQEALVFPYIEGAVFMHGLWAAGSRVPPFGEHLPLSTEQILAGADVSAPLDVRLRARGARIFHDDVLGRLELGLLLEEHAGPERATLADGWDGDRYALLEAPDGSTGLVSYVLWDTVATRDAFVETIRGALDRFGAEAEIRALDVAGRPASVLTVGPVGRIEVRAEVVEGA